MSASEDNLIEHKWQEPLDYRPATVTGPALSAGKRLKLAPMGTPAALEMTLTI
jgi:hypothetical protein